MTEVSSSYIYNVEVSIDQIDVYDNREIEDFDELETIVQFKMNPNVLLEFTEDEIIEAINCGEKKIKEAHFLMNENQLNNDLECCVIVKKVTKDGEHVVIGSYKPPLPNEYLRNLKSRYDEQQMRNEKSKLRSFSQISSSMNEMAPLKNEMRKSAGTVVYTLKMICFGPRNTRELSICDFEGFLSNTSINSKKRMEEKCLENCRPKKDYDEYIAEINGNSLTIRISKDSPYTVSQIFDACSSNDKLTIKGCDQQIDFKFPNNFSCYQCKKTFGTCKCTAVIKILSHCQSFEEI
ncbi:hypothetical protein PVAND_008426 [Polypedilum vanderplanki]|uniref:Uncharacterized protein n=1 Tax=Polypedilum vanderplanki TaxID=319348 RepID=A0A9J6CB18_POLVA|nr:hypothetical protein PVAND_008426 [Polypedilum vanderplanki]